MKNKLSVFLIFIVFTGLMQISIAQTNSNSNIDSWICGNHIFTDSLSQIALENTKLLDPATYQLMMNNLQDFTLKKTVADTLGSIKNFFTYNFVTKSYNTVNAKLLSKGTRVQIWVDTTELANNHASQGVADTLLNSLENQTTALSRDPAKGIVKLDEQYFGSPPNKDGDNLTDFLVYDIKDGWNGNTVTTFTAGYFDPDDQRDITNSNKKDLLYIDTYPGIFSNGTRNAQNPLGTLAHEYQHLIHYNYDKKEISFVNEGLSEIASVVCGYPLRSPAQYFKNTNIPLVNWNTSVNNKDVLADYSRAALFTLYYDEQMGDSVLQKVVQDTLVGITGLNHVFSSYSYNFSEIFQNFTIANTLKNKNINSKYGYTYNIPGSPKLYYNFNKPNIFTRTDSLYDYAVVYTKVSSLTDSVFIKLNGNNSSIKGNIVIANKNSASTVDTLSRGNDYTLLNFDTTIDSTICTVINTDTTKNSYSLNISSKDNNNYWTRSDYNAEFYIVYDGKSRFYMRTSNGGINYTDYPYDQINSLALTGNFSSITSKVFLKNDSVFVGTNAGEIYISADSGKTWNKISTAGINSTGSISDINIDSQHNIYISNFQQNSLFWRSSDNGQSWANLDNPNIFNTISKRGYSIITDEFSNVYACTDLDELFASTNKGSSWTLVDDSWDRFNSFLRLDNDGSLVTWTSKKGLFKRHGFTYAISTLGIPKDWIVRDIAFYPGKDSIMLVAVSYNPNFPDHGGVYMTTDSTATWQKMNNGLEDLYAISVGFDKNGNAIASTSTAIHRLNNTITGIKEIRSQTPLEYYLSQNYPNPFNPSTNIRFRVSNFVFVSLKIYDILGREVETLVNENKQPGFYEVSFDAGRLASGIYFYTIRAGEFNLTKKMILLR